MVYILIVKQLFIWNNKVFLKASKCNGAEPISFLKNIQGRKRKIVNRDKPGIVEIYNYYIESTDRMDKNINYGIIAIR